MIKSICRFLMPVCLAVIGFSACEKECQIPLVAEEPDFLVSYNPDGSRKGVLKVRFSREVLAAAGAFGTTPAASPYTGLKNIDKITALLGDAKISRVFPYAGKDEARLKAYGLDRWYRFEFDENIDLAKITTGYSLCDEIEWVQPEYKICFEREIKAAYDVPFEGGPETLPFNDPGLSKQWHYDQVGIVADPEAGSGLFRGWRVTAGLPEVVVAIVDMGVDCNHEDLAANVWINSGEIAGNNVDDDNNGRIDDIHGYNFINGNNKIEPGDHATHIAGTVAAVNNNGKGACGIAGGTGGGDGIRLMSCQVGNSAGQIRNVEEAIVYAALNGAVICQCSWNLAGDDRAVYDAIDFFVREAGKQERSPMKGGILFFGAGNEGREQKRYPAAYDNTVAVAAVTHENKKAAYSNYGNWVDLSAPGGDGSTGAKQHGVWSTLPGNTYGYMSGTSMACPHVAGIAALLVSAHAAENFTCQQLKKLLYNSVTDLTLIDPYYAPGLGKGLLRADKALWKDDGVAPLPVTDLRYTATDGEVSLTWTVTADPNDRTPKLYHLYYSDKLLNASNYRDAQHIGISVLKQKAGEPIRCDIPRLSVEGTYYAIVTGEDLWGNISEISNVVMWQWKNTENLPSENSGLKVYPNPVKTVVNVKWGEEFAGEKTIRLYDMSGREVFRQVIGDKAGSGEESFQLSSLAAGKYILELKSENMTQTRNIIKR